MAGLRAGLHDLAQDRGEWAGIPMPIEDAPLVIDPRYPMADKLSQIGRPPPYEPVEGELPPRAPRMINRWWSDAKKGEVAIWEVNGKRSWGIHYQAHGFDKALTALSVADAWGIEQEARAVNLLGTLLRHRQFKQYLLTGMFPERSERSGLTYIFRRLRPTVVLNTKGTRTKIMAALCMHPIAYYENSWAGAMAPTDDVVAHLMLMRGDEHLYWRRANQHPAWRPEAGL